MKNIFVHIPKTGGVSIMRSVYDKDVSGAELMRALNKRGIKVIGHNIRTSHYQWLKDYVKKDTEKKFIFTFVRNPWDRAVSSFFYLNEGGNNAEDEKDRINYLEKYNGDFKHFVHSAFLDKEIFNQMHFKPQHEWISDDGGNLLTDFIGKYKNYKNDLEKLSALLDFDFLENIKHFNKSHHRNYREYYDDETIEIIGNAYEKDIELFNYEF